jgi:hypothetical protein
MNVRWFQNYGKHEKIGYLGQQIFLFFVTFKPAMDFLFLSFETWSPTLAE